MVVKQLKECLDVTDGVEASGDGEYRFGKQHEGTFYFGENGSLTVTKVRSLQLRGDLLQLTSSEERAFFSCEDLTGFKVRIPSEGAGPGARAGFSSH